VQEIPWRLAIDIETSKTHLCVNKCDPFLMKSILDGDLEGGYPREGIWVNAVGEMLVFDNVFNIKQIRIEYIEHLDPYHDIQ